MDKLIIEGRVNLKGQIKVSGSKNSALPILAATLLSEGKCKVNNLPNLTDIYTMVKILRALGVEVEFKDGQAVVDASRYKKYIASYKLVSTMRASFCVLGPILARKKIAQVSLPGGCVIGVRPVDLHLKGLTELGAHIDIQGGYVQARADRLRGRHIYLGGAFGSSVLATDNVMMAACLAKGKTIIENAACEPEVKDLGDFLNKMGGKVSGHGTPIIEITGVKSLHGAEYTIMNDRIEAGTFMLAAAVTYSEITIANAPTPFLGAIIHKMQEAGVKIKTSGTSIIEVKGKKSLKPISVATHPYPGFPTDMQAQFMTLMSLTPGISIISEKIFPDRFMHIAELNRMGAQIRREGPHAIVNGVKALKGAPVMASDLRASAALVLAGLAAKGRTEISRIYHLDRGYERLDEKLRSLGANIWREKE